MAHLKNYVIRSKEILGESRSGKVVTSEQRKTVAIDMGTENIQAEGCSKPPAPAKQSLHAKDFENEATPAGSTSHTVSNGEDSDPVRSPCSWIPRRASLPVLAFVMFCVFTGAGIGIALTLRMARQDYLQDQASALADETGRDLSNQLERSVTPLYSMAKFTNHLKVFQDLSKQVEQLPRSEEDPDYRQVAGVCDDPALVDVFVDIASDLKKSAGMDGILANIQLAPQGVICLLHPINNTEDFDEGEYLDSTSSWGVDILNHSLLTDAGLESMKAGELTLNGPRPLRQCPECGLFYVARLPIIDENNGIVLDGEPYPRWGFATALINWEHLVAKSGVNAIYETNQFEYRLSREDYVVDPLTGKSVENVLVSSAGFDSAQEQYEYHTTYVDTIDGEWKLVVVYDQLDIGFSMLTIVAICVLISLFTTGLVYIVLAQRQIHATMQAESLAQEAKVSTERNMTAYFAHELRNPLSALDSALGSISQEELPGNTKGIFDGMQKCSSFMISIMNNLLDSRKLEEGKMQLRSVPMSLSALVDGCHTMMKPTVRPGVAFFVDKDIPAGHNWVLGDQHRIQQVLTNVLTNAAKYTLQGSVTITVSWKDDLVQLECIDTGPGIPLNEQKQLFERFVQRGGAPGTGLGLNIAKRIVDMCDGSICLESDPTVKPGTTCRILLPLPLCEEPDEEDPERVVEAAIEEEISVLIVDDMEMNRKMLEHRIKRVIAPNAKIVMAETGEEALELCKEMEFDIIICDQYMEASGGVMVGTDTIIAMRRMKVAAFIVGCSGNDLDSSFFDAGVNTVWGKPLPSNAHIIRQWRNGLIGRLAKDDSHGNVNNPI